MFKAKIKIVHEKCWSQALATVYQGKIYQQQSASLKANTTSDVFFLQATLKEQEKVIAFIKKESSIEDFEILEQTANSLLILIITKDINTIVGRVIKNKCFTLAPSTLENGIEFWTVGASSKENIRKLIEDLQEVGTASLVSIVPYRFDRKELTTKQEDVVKLAYEKGYYTWPRKIDTSKLAHISKSSKSTFVEHLRKAEEKIIKEFLD